MRTTHSIMVTYPLAGSEDGLPLEIRFDYEPHPKLNPTIAFRSVATVGMGRLPAVIQDAIKAWAEGWLDDDEGHHRAWDVAVDDTERAREAARDMGMIRS